MEVISQEKLNALIGMGFEVACKSDGYIRLVNGKYPFQITMYHSDPMDDWQGVYMSINDLDGKEIKLYSARNAISNAARWIKKFSKTEVSKNETR